MLLITFFVAILYWCCSFGFRVCSKHGVCEYVLVACNCDFFFICFVCVWILMKWIQSFIVLTREIQVSKLLVDYTLLFSFFLWNRMLVSLLLIFCYASHWSAAKCKVRLKSFIVMATSDCSTRLRMYQSISQYSNLWSKSLFERCLEYGR